MSLLKDLLANDADLDKLEVRLTRIFASCLAEALKQVSATLPAITSQCAADTLEQMTEAVEKAAPAIAGAVTDSVLRQLSGLSIQRQPK